MTEHFDALETRSSDEREAALFSQLPDLIAHAQSNSPAWGELLKGVDAKSIKDRAALAALPVLRKPELADMQKAAPPFGDLTTTGPENFGHVFMSPGPVWEPQPDGADPWNGARALFAAGFRKGDIVHNAFAYHMTPGAFIFDFAARALGCAVFPAGIGNTEMQVAAIAALKPTGFSGTPDYLKVIMEHADNEGVDVSSINKAMVGGGALPESLRKWYADNGVKVLQNFGTADLGIIAYESEALEGMILNENYILEIVKPGTGEPVVEGEVGEMVVTIFNQTYPLIRFGTGDMSAILSGPSPCGRTNTRIKGWMGRADQRTKVKGMFVDPAQIAEISKKHPELGRLRLVVDRANEQDVMVLKAECDDAGDDLQGAVEATVQAVCKLKGNVEIVEKGSLPNDGKVIADERVYD